MRGIFSLCGPARAGFLLGAVVGNLALTGADWPRYRGPNQDGIALEKDWLGAWPGGQPKQLWKGNVGVGFSSVAVVGNRVYTLGHDGAKEGQDRIVCLDATTGRELWRKEYPQKLHAKYYEGGTSSTPTVEAGRVYTLSKFGQAFCLEAETGREIWARDLVADLGLKVPEWGFSGSPHLEGDLVVFNVGDFGAALDRATGRDVWKSGPGAAGYGTPVPFQHAGRRALAIFAAKSVVAIDPASGRELWRFPWETQYDVNAADPVIQGDLMYLSTGYGKGGAGVKLEPSGPRQLWFNKEIRAQMASPILMGDQVYGVDGSGGEASTLKCLDLKTGALKWASPKAETGVLAAAADGKLIWVTGKGELVVVRANPEKYEEIARAQVTSGKIWAAPVLANGRLYVRNWKGDLVCVDLRAKG